ncbi:hypothetical protein BFW01_g4379 [Lasiodiplodia theobromae]|uniref:Uncharacterized protein n=1 Tax=Lasiodiplodia theobromae TaxID=45133 RepID=A0A5N5DJ50_9PEZI|nr:Chitin deacetylase [Lasiodiplodia theobromae]KAB2577895.1 hypothetical protein DBV05_g3657 [Lasiodiplodia theobromae]KAF4538384.1 Chitin deacetylase [Lasiodiplodia theobromae]KAF9633485.1 hypothetical protein BFW01_g4379 [Lasiodiplodia theobromae]
MASQNTSARSASSGQPSKAKEASDTFLPGRHSTDTVSTLPEYTEKSDDNNGGSNAESSTTSSKKSKLSSTFDRVKAKMGGEPDDPERAEKKARRREEYEKLGLGDRTKYGVGGMGWSG